MAQRQSAHREREEKGGPMILIKALGMLALAYAIGVVMLGFSR